MSENISWSPVPVTGGVLALVLSNPVLIVTVAEVIFVVSKFVNVASLSTIEIPVLAGS